MSKSNNMPLWLFAIGTVVILINIGTATILAKTKIKIPYQLESVIDLFSAITMTIAINLVIGGACGFILQILGLIWNRNRS